MGYLYLTVAIVAEVIATSALKSADGFTRPLPTAVVAVGYVLAFYMLSLTLRTIPVGIAYAIWSGVGIVAIAAIAWVVHKQALDLPAVVGMALICAGILVLQLFSKTAGH